MIESGSLVPGVDFASYGLPEATAMRLELPAPDLRAFVSNYHAYDSDGARWDGVINYALPTWPTIRFVLSAGAIRVKLGPRNYNPVPAAALYGTTSRAREITTHGGLSVGLAVTPLGWSRLFAQAADAHRDRIIPLTELLPAAAVARVTAQLQALGDDLAQMGPILDAFIREHLRPATARDADIANLTRLIAADETTDIAVAAARLELNLTALRRLATRYFGFPPKLLLVRHRFLRGFVAMLLAGDGQLDYRLIPPSYFDLSHFLRDANRFLGTTPRRFATADHGFLLARLRAYRALAEISGTESIYA